MDQDSTAASLCPTPPLLPLPPIYPLSKESHEQKEIKGESYQERLLVSHQLCLKGSNISTPYCPDRLSEQLKQKGLNDKSRRGRGQQLAAAQDRTHKTYITSRLRKPLHHKVNYLEDNSKEVEGPHQFKEIN